MQGSYSDLLMDQIKNSQEKDRLFDEASGANIMVQSTLVSFIDEKNSAFK